MNRIRNIISGLSQSLLLLFLCFSLLMLLITGKDGILVSPIYRKFIFISAVIIFAFFLISLKNISGFSQASGSFVSRILMLIISTAFYFISYENFQERISSLRTFSVKNNSASAEGRQQLADKSVISMDDLNYVRYIYDIYDNPALYEGKKIIIKGFIMRPDMLEEPLFIIARLNMYCCAADASIVGFICILHQSDFTFDEKKWYDINGTMGLKNLTLASGTDIYPVIYVDQITETGAADSPYVYPFYNGD